MCSAIADDSVKIGLLGAARITKRAVIDPSHRVPGVTIHQIAARDLRRAEVFAKEHGIEYACDSYSELIESPHVDLVYIALPLSLHSKWAIKALEAGKHVLCEKPMAMNTAEAEQIIDAAAQSERRFVEALHYRYHPAFRTFLNWLAVRAVGEIASIDASFRIGIPDDGKDIRYRPELGGGAMMELGCYPVSWLVHATSCEPSHITANAARSSSGVDESMQATLHFEGYRMIANLDCSMAVGNEFSNSLIIKGEKGSIVFENPLAPHNGASLSLFSSGKTQTADIDKRSTYEHQLRAVVDRLRVDASLPTEGHRLIQQQRILDNIYSAAGLSELRQAVYHT